VKPEDIAHIDALLSRIDSLVDEGKPITESDDSVGIGTGIYEAPQQFSMKIVEDDTP
jgi:hypothetical protein